ncbi:MAG: helix-turn-helix domain-containing protein [Solirubrobacterales bacterium]
MDACRCRNCGREFDSPAPTISLERCADCAPQRGVGSHLLARFAENLRRAREEAGTSQLELARRARLDRSRISCHELCRREPGTGTVIRIASVLEVPLGRLFEGIYWNPGEVAPAPSRRRPHSLRLAGFFQVTALPVELDPSALPAEVVETRRQAAGAFGRRLRAARDRRHLSQGHLAAAVGFARTGISQLEHGHRETTLEVAIALARALEVRPEALLLGIEWKPGGPGARAPAGALQVRPIPTEEVVDGEPEAKGAQVAAEIGKAVAHYRGAAGLTLEQLGEAIELHRARLHHLERGRFVPRIAMLLKTAAALNLQPVALTAGIGWDADARVFRLRRHAPEPPAGVEIIAANIVRARRRLGASQADLAFLSGVNRSDVTAFECGERNFRLSTGIRLAAGLGIDFSELFVGVVDWHVRPLPPPMVIEPTMARDPQRPSPERERSLLGAS